MLMRKLVTNEGVTVILDDPNRERPRSVDVSCLRILPDQQIDLLIGATFKMIASKKLESQLDVVRHALVKYSYFVAEKKTETLPKGFGNWQIHVLEWFSWYLAYKSDSCSLTQRVSYWDMLAIKWLEALVAEGMLPEGLVFPRAKLKWEKGKVRKPQNPSLLGEEPAKPTKAPIDKTIAGPIFWRTDLEYLLEIEESLKQRNQVIKNVADDYWLRLIKDFRAGKNLMRRIDGGELQRRVRADDWSPGDLGGRWPRPMYVASPGAPNAAAWGLVMLRDILSRSNDRDAFTAKHLEKQPGLPSRFLSRTEPTPIIELRTFSALSNAQLEHLDIRQTFLRFLGILTSIDVVVATLILIQEHPNLNPSSIINAKLLNTKGKYHILFGGESNKKIVFSVDKPRARKRKYAVLSKRASRILKHIVRSTSEIRSLLRSAGYKHWRRLFLGCPGGRNARLGILTVNSTKLSAPYGSSLAFFYPELEKAGLRRGVFDFAKLRATQGTLKWFETGSIQAASRHLGNSNRVALDHYIPEPLVRLWNERLVRRFQNTLIVLAASDKDYLIDVTDIDSLDELHSFIIQIITENPVGSSPIADRIHADLPKLISEPTTDREALDSSREAQILSVRLGAESLTLLYAYQTIATKSLDDEALDRVNPRSGVSPRSMVELAALFRTATQQDEVGEALTDLLDLARLRQLDEIACDRLPAVLQKLENLRVVRSWGTSL